MNKKNNLKLFFLAEINIFLNFNFSIIFIFKKIITSIKKMSSVDTRSVLLLVSAGDCGACKYYETNKIFDQIKEAIAKDNLVRYEHIKLEKMNSGVDKKYPEIINRWIRSYPTFILINGKDWNNGLKDIDEKNPNIEVFNARVIEGVITPIQNNINSGVDKLPVWIKENLTNNSKFKSAVIISSKVPQIAEKDKSKTNITIEKPKYIPTCGAVKILASNRR